MHLPVMPAEVRDLLCEGDRRLIVDATIGTGGHAEMLLEATGATLLGLDRDPLALEAAAERLRRFGPRVVLRQDSSGKTFMRSRKSATFAVRTREARLTAPRRNSDATIMLMPMSSSPDLAIRAATRP